MKKINLVVFLFVLAINLNMVGMIFADENTITIYCNKKIGAVNKKIFGNNLIGYDPMTYERRAKEYYGYSDYGAGIWDPKLNQFAKEAIDLAKSAGISVARFPGGCGAHHYDWKKAIGKNRGHFLYGIDEFLKTCQEMGTEAIFTVSYFTGDEQDAADLVEYLNAPGNGVHKWATRRAENGHPEPYNVKYFEIGNEDWHGNHRDIKKVLPEEYANRYLKYYKAIKKIDPSVNIGAILYTPAWNRKVMQRIKENIDFGILHIYPSARTSINSEDIFKIVLGIKALQVKMDLHGASSLLKEKSGRDIPLAITEYNGGFAQEKPLPYRHCLGTALLNAELLRIFMKPEYNILMANYWQFCNSYWGMVANGFNGNYETLNKLYYKRPNFYVFELYNKHFGEELISAEIQSKFYMIDGKEIPYLSVNASKSTDGNKVYLMVINKNMDRGITATINLRDFKPAKEINTWILNGPSVDATNEEDHENVRVIQKTLEINNNPFEFTFEPHSLTAIEISRSS